MKYNLHSDYWSHDTTYMSYVISILKQDLNRGFNECLLEFDTCSNPLSHHGWITFNRVSSAYSFECKIQLFSCEIVEWSSCHVLKVSSWGLIPGNLNFLGIKFFKTYFLKLSSRLLIYCWCLELRISSKLCASIIKGLILSSWVKVICKAVSSAT